MTGTRIVYAVLDTQHLILYKEGTGEKIYIEQGDSRLRRIVDQITPILNAGGVATVVLGHPEPNNEYAAFEKKTNGLVRLFRVAKKAVSHLFGGDDEAPAEALPPMTIGQAPSLEPAQKQNPAAGVSKQTVDEIMAHATPVSSPNYRESETTKEHTMVAVVGQGKDARVIPGVEGLKGQFAHANKLDSTKAVEALLQRLGKVIDKRGHSVQDVMRFVERGDLPVSEEGDIIAYKVLTRTPKSGAKFVAKDGRFFDCHSGKVPQEIGSFVCMDEKLVDLNRRQECSVGLHIARRAYLRHFSGDVCTIVRIRPEDVITVPVHEADKVRVRGYHILGVLPATDWSNLKAGKPLSSEYAQELLGQAISGKHVAITEQVQISGPMGDDVTVTPMQNGRPLTAPPVTAAPKAEAIADEAFTSPKPPPKEAPVDPKAVSKTVTDQKAQPSRGELAKQLIGRVLNLDLPFDERKNAAEALVALKKKTKVSYAILGLTQVQERKLLDLVGARNQGQETVAKVRSAQLEHAIANPPIPKPTPVAPPVPIKLAIKAPAQPIPAKVEAAPKTRREEASYLVLVMTAGRTAPARVTAAKDLLALKQKAKISWSALGVTDAQVSEMNYLTSPTPAAVATAKKGVKAAALSGAKVASVSKAAVTKVESLPTPPAGSTRMVVAKFYWGFIDSKSAPENQRKEAAQRLLAHKKSVKVGWVALGLPEDAGKFIDKLTQTTN